MEYLRNPRAATIAKVMSAYDEYYHHLHTTEQDKAFAEISKMISSNIVVFMRGDPEEPKCKGSKTVVETLTKM